MKLLLLLLVLAAAAVFEVLSRRAGPPIQESDNFDRICNQMLPNHGGTAARSGNGGYTISTDIPRSDSSGYNYTAGQNYTVTLRGTNTFLGFLVIAHVPGQNNMLLGAFTPQNVNQQTLNCDGVGAATTATVAHSNDARTQFSSMTFMWQAPSDSDGTVDFRYTVVRSYNEFYVRQSAASNIRSPPQTDNSTTIPPRGDGLITPTMAPGDYRLTFRSPPDCAPSECNVFVGIDTNTGNSSYLDIYLEGQADGWVAVGFSATSSMSLADVVACNRDPATNMVEALDTWNTQGFNNNVDIIQDVERFSSSYSGGRIKCSVAKKIAPSGTNQDLHLSNDYYILYGRRRGLSIIDALTQHELGPTNNPLISLMTVNPVTAGGSVGVFPKLPVLRFHGILMIIAWPLLALYGIFFASWMRPVLPNGGWFQAHRAFLLASMFVGTAGFIVAFIANYPTGLISFGSSNPTGTAHFIIGIMVMLLHILNPIISAFRCKPTEKLRWVFNLFHGTIIGALAEVAALINVSLGTFLLFQSYSALFWVFIIYLILYLVMFVVLLLLFTLTSCLSTDPDRKKLAPSLTKPLISSPPKSSGDKDIPLSQLDSSPKNDDSTEETETKMSSFFKDSNIRWASFFIFLVLSAPLILVLIGLVTVL